MNLRPLILMYLLVISVSVSCSSPKDQLFEAIKKGKPKEVKSLLDSGVSVYQTDDTGRGLLHMTSKKCDLKLTEYLIEKGINVNAQDHEGRTAAHTLVLDSPKLKKDSEDLKRRVQWLRLLHKNKANFSLQDRYGQTLLHYMAKMDREVLAGGFLGLSRHYDKFATRLLKINLKDHKGKTALDLATSKKLAKAIKRKGGRKGNHWSEYNYPLFKAAKAGELDEVKRLVTLGANIRAKDHRKFYATPLLYAASKDHLDVVKYLISQGIKVNESNLFGSTAILYASSEKHFDVVQYLIGEGAKVNLDLYSSLSYQPIQHAVSNNDLAMTRLLMKAGADFDWTREHDPLTIAAEKGYLDMVKLLIHSGTCFRTSDALTMAAENGHIHIVKYLIRKGVVVKREDKTKVKDILREAMRKKKLTTK